MKKIFLMLSLAMVLLFTSCSSKQTKKVVEMGDEEKENSKTEVLVKRIQGNLKQGDWILKYFKDPIDFIKVGKEAKNYSIQVDILVSDKNLEGKTWDLKDYAPDLKLYIKTGEDYTLIKKQENAYQLSIKKLLILSNKSVIDLKLADEEKFYTDDETGTKDSPIAHIKFDFKGQGKYLYFSGGAIFIITIKQL